MASNSFGEMFRVTTWGESHGVAIGAVVDGCPARLPLTEEDLQPFLDRRRPGQSSFTTQRHEADRVRIFSGTFEGMTTGAPLSLVIDNTDMRSRDYSEIAEKFRPGHADYTYQAKYGIRDYRGGGRSSARETACRVAAGGVARKLLTQALGPSFSLHGGVIQLGTHRLDPASRDWQAASENDLFCPDPSALPLWQETLEATRKQGSSVGAVIEIVARGVPVGLGDPLYEKLDGELARALMSINAVKGVEIGEGFAAAGLTGPQNADEMRQGPDGKPVFLSNHAGGILGGISTGAELVLRFAVKPTSSILAPQRTVNVKGEETEISTKGRHDPCVGLRAVPVGEAMVACVLADALLRARALRADRDKVGPFLGQPFA